MSPTYSYPKPRFQQQMKSGAAKLMIHSHQLLYISELNLGYYWVTMRLLSWICYHQPMFWI